MRPLALAVLVAALVAGCGGGGEDLPITLSGEQAKAFPAARGVYGQARAQGEDLERGPCISESLPGLPDWVADIAHDPRQPVDDQPANQCARYRSGEAHHFVELSPTGQLIRAQ